MLTLSPSEQNSNTEVRWVKLLNEVKYSNNTNLRKFNAEGDKARKLTWISNELSYTLINKVKRKAALLTKL
ncbi:MAG: hypothetical protein ACTS44_01480 [Candidatus Hodgkinia cicadicola]